MRTSRYAIHRVEANHLVIRRLGFWACLLMIVGVGDLVLADPWDYVAVPNHNDRGAYRYLAAPPPNLAEDSAPQRTTAGADIILRYNGRWGAFGRSLQPWVDQSPSLGSALHKLWARPQSGAPLADCLE